VVVVVVVPEVVEVPEEAAPVREYLQHPLEDATIAHIMTDTDDITVTIQVTEILAVVAAGM